MHCSFPTVIWKASSYRVFKQIYLEKVDWLIVWCLTLFSRLLQLHCGSQCTSSCFFGVLLTSTSQYILSKPLTGFPHNHHQNNKGGMNPVAMTIINPWTEYWLSQRVVLSSRLPTGYWKRVEKKKKLQQYPFFLLSIIFPDWQDYLWNSCSRMQCRAGWRKVLIYSTFYHTVLWKTAFENIVGKGQNACSQHLSPHPEMFSYFSQKTPLFLQFFCFSLFLIFNPFPHNDTFWCPWETRLLKTLWEKEKLFVTSNFSFSHSVFYRFV